MPTDPQLSRGFELDNPHRMPTRRSRKTSGVTLVEIMVAMLVLMMAMLVYLGSFLQSRRLTESSILHAAATSMIYGIIEQIKTLDYEDSLPYLGTRDPNTGEVVDANKTDPADPNATKPPFIRVRINQNKVAWLKVVWTKAPAVTNPVTPPTPKGPTATPDAGVAAGTLGAINNFIGSIPLSTVTGTASQEINLNLWVWIDEIPDAAKDVNDVKKITVVYSYDCLDGGKIRTIRDREVVLRTRYEQ